MSAADEAFFWQISLIAQWNWECKFFFSVDTKDDQPQYQTA